MSPSGLWHALGELMTNTAVLVDVLRAVCLWACLLLLPAYLIALIVWMFDRLSDDGSPAVDAPSAHQPMKLRDRLDRMMDLSISQRPATRKRRHRHHHHRSHHPNRTVVL